MALLAGRETLGTLAIWSPIPKLPRTILEPERRTMDKKISRSFLRIVQLESLEMQSVDWVASLRRGFPVQTPAAQG